VIEPGGHVIEIIIIISVHQVPRARMLKVPTATLPTLTAGPVKLHVTCRIANNIDSGFTERTSPEHFHSAKSCSSSNGIEHTFSETSCMPKAPFRFRTRFHCNNLIFEHIVNMIISLHNIIYGNCAPRVCLQMLVLKPFLKCDQEDSTFSFYANN
jgi:hypothetical protein